MFRITENPSSESFVQCLAKIIKMALSCPLTCIWYIVNYTHAHRVRLCCHNTDYVHVKGHDRAIFIILAKHCTQLPDDGYSVIRNMSEQF